jgi:hypothetical protein
MNEKPLPAFLRSPSIKKGLQRHSISSLISHNSSLISNPAASTVFARKLLPAASYVPTIVTQEVREGNSKGEFN